MKLPNETCRVIISLKDNTLIKGVYDPAIGFMTSDGRCIWKENVLDFKLEPPKESEIMELSPSEYVDCEKAQKCGELCLGFGGNGDEPCEQCKNCIKCETGYYQLGETEKDEELNKLQAQIEKMKCCENCKHHYWAGGADLCCRLRENECKDKIKLEKWEFES